MQGDEAFPGRVHRLPRRKFLALAGGAGGATILGVAGAGCGSTNNGSSNGGSTKHGVQIPNAALIPGPSPVSGGHYGGKIVAGYATPPDSNDPAQSYNLFSYDIATELVFFGGLLAYSSQYGGPIPNLAAAMPEISSDKKTFTFRLRPGIKFHNGREITADDVKYAWERVLTPAVASWGSSYFAGIIGSAAMLKGHTKTLAGVEVVNSRTLKVHLSQPNFTFLNAVCQPFSGPVPREEVERLGSSWSKTPVGFGPFKIVSQDESAQVARFVRFDDYFWRGLPYVDEVEMHWGSSDETLLLQLKAGAIDIIGDGIPGNLTGQTQTDRSLKPMVHNVPVHSSAKFMMNVTKPPLNDVRVRQALNWAIDRQNIAKALYGSVLPDGTPFPLNLGFTPTFHAYGYDPSKAKQLLAQAGHATGLSLTLTTDVADPWPTFAQIVQQNLAAVHVSTNIQPLKSNVYTQLAQQGKLQMWPDEWYMVQPTAADIVDNQYVTGAGSNYSHFSNTEVDRLAAKAHGYFDPRQQNALYAQIEQIIGAEAPAVYMVNVVYDGGVNNSLVDNWQYRGEYGNYYDRMWVAK